MSGRTLVTVVLSFALAGAAAAQPADGTASGATTGSVELGNMLRPALGIAPASGSTLPSSASPTAASGTSQAPAAAPGAQPPDGYMEPEGDAMRDLDSWFIHYGTTLGRAE
jgi:hypothetical protein